MMQDNQIEGLTENNRENQAKKIICKDSIIKEFVDARLVHRSPNTKRDYCSIIRDFLDFISPDFEEVDNIDIDMISKYQASKIDKWSENTKSRNYNLIRYFLKYLFKRKYIPDDLSDEIDVPGKIDTDPFVPSDYEVKLFFKTVERLYKKKEEEFIFYNLYKVYSMTGFRLMEVIDLDVEDIDFIRNSIKLRKTKSGKNKTFPLYRRLKKTIINYLKKSNIKKGPVFIWKKGKRIDRHIVQDNMKIIIQAAGLPDNFTVHSFRNYFLDYCRRKKIDIFKMRSLARHRDINTTYKYCKVKEEELLKELKKEIYNI